jgi:hypothetical protein
MTAYASCWGYGADIRVSGPQISPSGLLAIDAACPEGDRRSRLVWEEGRRFEAFLQSPFRFKAAGERLILLGEHGRRLELHSAPTR